MELSDFTEQIKEAIADNYGYIQLNDLWLKEGGDFIAVVEGDTYRNENGDFAETNIYRMYLQFADFEVPFKIEDINKIIKELES